MLTKTMFLSLRSVERIGVVSISLLLSACSKAKSPDPPASSVRPDAAAPAKVTSTPLTEPLRLQGEKVSTKRFAIWPRIAVWNDATVVVLEDNCEDVRVWRQGGARKDVRIPGCARASIDASGERVAALVEGSKDQLQVVELQTGASRTLLERGGDDPSWIGDRVFLTYGSSAVRAPSFVDLKGNIGESKDVPYVDYNAVFVAASQDGSSFVLYRDAAMGSWLDFYHSSNVKRVKGDRPHGAAVSGETALFVT